MRTRIYTTLLATAVIAVATLMSTQTAQAQCAAINVFNFTGCDLTLCIYDAGGNRACIPIRAFGNPFTFAFVAPFTPVGVISAGKNPYPFDPVTGCTPCIMLPGATVLQGCCAQVCYDPVNCIMTVTSCGPPCLP